MSLFSTLGGIPVKEGKKGEEDVLWRQEKLEHRRNVETDTKRGSTFEEKKRRWQ